MYHTYMLIALVFISVVACALLYLLLTKQTPKEQNDLRSELRELRQSVIQSVDRQRESSERSDGLMHSRIDQSTRMMAGVQSKLIQLEAASQTVVSLGQDIAKLQQVLQAPKLRGTLGEVWLKELISQILPASSFKMQHTFLSGEICDAVIMLQGGTLLPVDSKFSLENFAKMLEGSEAQRPAYRKMFASDVKKRIDEIARKYILPGEGTLDFAFMYVPAENVYYQAFIQGEEDLGLLAYAFSRHVIPVSPSSMYAYLQVILFGLSGQEIAEGAKRIQKNVRGLQGEIIAFREQYDKVGSHLRHAASSYDQTGRRFERVEQRVEKLADQEETLITISDASH